MVIYDVELCSSGIAFLQCDDFLLFCDFDVSNMIYVDTATYTFG